VGARDGERFVSPSEQAERILSASTRRSRYSAWRTFTRNDLNQVLAKIADREPDLRLAA
jgi:hypothetical protein